MATKTKTAKKPMKRSPKLFFFMVAAKAMYERDEKLKERTVNVVLKSPHMELYQSSLNTAQQAVMARLQAENNVAPNDVKDIVFLNIFPMAHVTEETFHNVGKNTPAH